MSIPELKVFRYLMWHENSICKGLRANEGQEIHDLFATKRNELEAIIYNLDLSEGEQETSDDCYNLLSMYMFGVSRRGLGKRRFELAENLLPYLAEFLTKNNIDLRLF